MTALVLAMAGAGCTGSPAGDHVTSPVLSPTASGRLLPASPSALPDFDPGAFRQLLAGLRGKPVVINIWGSWCGPCIAEAPDLARISAAFRDRVQFIGVDIMDFRTPAQAFIRRYGWTYPSVFDRPAAIRDDLGFIGQPDTVVLDATGKRVFVSSGPIDPSKLSAQLTALTEASP
jgi:thiol-disulfide isomerase/thioredoxin